MSRGQEARANQPRKGVYLSAHTSAQDRTTRTFLSLLFRCLQLPHCSHCARFLPCCNCYCCLRTPDWQAIACHACKRGSAQQQGKHATMEAAPATCPSALAASQPVRKNSQQLTVGM